MSIRNRIRKSVNTSYLRDNITKLSNSIGSKIKNSHIAKKILKQFKLLSGWLRFLLKHWKLLVISVFIITTIYNITGLIVSISDSFGKSPHFYCDKFTKTMQFNLWSKYCEDLDIQMIDGDGNLGIAYAAARLISDTKIYADPSSSLDTTNNWGGTKYYEEVQNEIISLSNLSAGPSYEECGRFAWTAVLWSGADDEFAHVFSGGNNGSSIKNNKYYQYLYLHTSDKWVEVDTQKSVSNLLPGDILVCCDDSPGTTRHIFIYVGEEIMNQMYSTYYEHSSPDSSRHTQTGYNAAQASYFEYGGCPLTVWDSDLEKYKAFRCIKPDNSSKYIMAGGGGGFEHINGGGVSVTKGKLEITLDNTSKSNLITKLQPSSFLTPFIYSYAAVIGNKDYGECNPEHFVLKSNDYQFGIFGLNKNYSVEFINSLELTANDKAWLAKKHNIDEKDIDSKIAKLKESFSNNDITSENIKLFKSLLSCTNSQQLQLQLFSKQVKSIDIPTYCDSTYNKALYVYIYNMSTKEEAENICKTISIYDNEDDIIGYLKSYGKYSKFIELLKENYTSG